MSTPAIMWFRNDLRLAANAALAAAAAAGQVIPLFVLDDETPAKWRTGGASRWWLHRSLDALSKRIPLLLRRGRADAVLQEVLRGTGATSVHFARGYEPWSGPLERRVKDVCDAQGAACHRYGGFLLHEPEAIRNGAGEPYKVYTPFSRACFAAGEPKLVKPAPEVDWWRGTLNSDRLADWQLLPTKPNWARQFEPEWQPGEEGARTKLLQFIENGLRDYGTGRDFPARQVTSRLSPHLHFGEISPAQCWQAVRAAAAGGNDAAAEKFLKEVLWREFSYHLLQLFPQLPEKAFKPEYDVFPWRDDPENLRRWQKGETGYPIVDAGMRELWATGTMHNRVRMIAASFLIKHLLIDWRHGARWFWDMLVDADIASNSASWQWVAGSGADAAPYFRIFNPVLQGEKFDGEGVYVRKWLPELQALPNEFVHKPWEAPEAALRAAGVELGRNYPHPVVDHGLARNRALAALKSLRGKPE